MSQHYKAAGVDLASEHSFSSYAGSLCRSTFKNSPYVEVIDPTGGFRGPRYYRYANLPGPVDFDQSSDGTGTKPVLTNASRAWENAGRDLLEMLLMDFTRYGRLGLVVNNDIMLRSLGDPGSDVHIANRAILFGLAGACNEARVVLYRGETAQCGVCVSGEDSSNPNNYLWSGSVHGLRSDKLEITGESLQAGQPIMALYEPSSACNGISLLRTGLRYAYGDDWYSNPAAAAYVEMAAQPCTIYDPFLTTINGWYDNFVPRIKVAAIAHVTGGGIEEKLGKDILFPRNLSADLTDLFDPPEIFKRTAEWVEAKTGTPITDEDLYKTFACGQRALVVLESETDENSFVREAESFGLTARRAGTVKNPEAPRIRITSKFSGETFAYNKAA